MVVKDSSLLLVISRMQVVLWARGSHFTPDPGHPIQRRGDGKDCAPLPPKERGVRWASLAIFFLALGLGDYLHLGTSGTCSRPELQAWGVFGWSDGTGPF